VFPDLELALGGWNNQLGEYILDCDELRTCATCTPPRSTAAGRVVFRHACICDRDTDLAATAEGKPPPVR
jgi:hypothetical protein